MFIANKLVYIFIINNKPIYISIVPENYYLATSLANILPKNYFNYSKPSYYFYKYIELKYITNLKNIKEDKEEGFKLRKENT